MLNNKEWLETKISQLGGCPAVARELGIHKMVVYRSAKKLGIDLKSIPKKRIYDEQTTCEIEGCNVFSSRSKNTLCEKHYYRLRRHGKATLDWRNEPNGHCFQCAKEVLANKLYCSPRCATRHSRKVSEDPIVCVLCGESAYRRANAIFCSPKCQRRGQGLRDNYGLEYNKYRELLQDQGGKCAICAVEMEEPHVDHDHDTGKIRGLLCSRCNVGVGFFRNRPDLLLSAIQYLENTS